MQIPRAPAWVMPGAKFDLDFANSRYWGGSVGLCPFNNAVAMAGVLVTGPTVYNPIYFPDNAGLLHNIPSYYPPITPGMGLWTCPNFINLCLYNRDLTQAAWTNSNVAAAHTQTGADGTGNGATSLTASAANATITQSSTQSSAAFVGSAYVKRLTGSGAVSMTLDGSTWTNIASQINAAGFTFVTVPTQTIANPTIGFQIATSGDAIAVDFAQMHAGAVASVGMLATSSATVQSYTVEPTIGVLNGSPGDGQRIVNDIFAGGNPYAIFGRFSGTPSQTTGSSVGYGWLMSSDAQINCQAGADGNPFYFGNTYSGTSGTAGLGNINKVAGRVNGKGAVSCINGGALGSYNSAKVPVGHSGAGTHIGLGNNGSGNNGGPLNGYIARLAFWSREIADGQMVEWTRAGSPY